jgi:hypothetical protein
MIAQHAFITEDHALTSEDQRVRNVIPDDIIKDLCFLSAGIRVDRSFLLGQ